MVLMLTLYVMVCPDCVHSVAKWTQQLAASSADRKESECEVDELRRRCDQMKHQLETALVDNKCKVALDEHMMTVSQLKRSVQSGPN